jgi:hypothetical protein
MPRPKGLPISAEHKAKLIAGSVAARTGKELPRNVLVTCQSCKKEFMAKNKTRRWCEVCSPDLKFRARLHNYGVSKPMWDAMLLEQGGHCALCDRPATAVDHDHETGVVRGLLCHGCNIALNRIDVPGWVEEAKKFALKGKV